MNHNTGLLKYSDFLKIKFTTEYLNFFLLKEATSNQEQKIGENAVSRMIIRALKKLKDQKILNVNVYHNYIYGVTTITALRMQKIICCAAVTDTKELPSGIS